MKVVKVLNNSVLLAVDDAGREVILMGKGLGFAMKVGDELADREIEKVFVLKDRATLQNIIQLASEIDGLYFEIAKAAIDYAVDTYHMELMEHLYLSLTDHLSFAVRRFREGKTLENFYTLDMKKFNPREYEMGRYCLELVKERTGVELPEDEIGYIAFHFINAQANNPYSEMNHQITEVVQRTLDIIQYNLKLIYDKDSVSYSRLVNHLQLFAQRLIGRNQIRDHGQDFLFEQVTTSCARSYDCVKKIGIYVESRFGMRLTMQEELYLTIHVHRILEEHKM